MSIDQPRIRLEDVPEQEKQAALKTTEKYVYERFADLIDLSVEDEFDADKLVNPGTKRLFRSFDESGKHGLLVDK